MNKFLDTKRLLQYGKQALNSICKYYDSIETMKVFPEIKPGHLRQVIPSEPPHAGQDMEKIIKEIEDIIIPNATHWQHPNFYAYFPSLVSHTTILSEMVAVGLNSPGFTWAASPVATELENIVVDWCVKMLGLPEKFLLKNSGGGMIGPTIGDDIFFSIHAAKYRKMKEMGMNYTDPRLLKLVGYYSAMSHSQNPKGLIIKDVPYRREIPAYYNKDLHTFEIKVEEFERMVKQDIQDGLVPFWCGSVIGATSTGSSDPIEALGKICKEHNIWLNVDAAWAGSAFVLPEISQSYRKGLELADSFEVNFGKWMMCGMNSALFYVSDKRIYNESMAGKGVENYIQPEFLQNKFTNEYDLTDYKDWQVGLGRRFSSLKIWALIKNFGVEGIKDNILEKIQIAEQFEAFVKSSDQFELVCQRELSLVCFRMIKNHKGEQLKPSEINQINRKLLQEINKSNEFHIVGAEVQGIYFLRCAICSHFTTSKHVSDFWSYVRKMSNQVFDK